MMYMSYLIHQNMLNMKLHILYKFRIHQYNIQTNNLSYMFPVNLYNINLDYMINMMNHKINRSLNSSKNQKNNLMYISPIFTYNISQKYTSNIDYLYYMQSNFIHIHNNLIREDNILQHRQRSMFLLQNYNSKEQYYKSCMKYSNLKNMLDKKNRRPNKFRSWFQNNLQHIHLNKFLIQS